MYFFLWLSNTNTQTCVGLPADLYSSHPPVTAPNFGNSTLRASHNCKQKNGYKCKPLQREIIQIRNSIHHTAWKTSKSLFIVFLRIQYTSLSLSAPPVLLCCLPLSSPWATVPRPMGWAYSVSSYSCVNMLSAYWSQSRTGPGNNFTVHITRPVIHFPLAFYWLCFDSHSNTGQSASLFSSIRDGCFCF